MLEQTAQLDIFLVERELSLRHNLQKLIKVISEYFGLIFFYRLLKYSLMMAADPLRVMEFLEAVFDILPIYSLAKFLKINYFFLLRSFFENSVVGRIIESVWKSKAERRLAAVRCKQKQNRKYINI